MKIEQSVFAILGAGAWGLSLAALLNSKQYRVIVWEYDARICAELDLKRSVPDKLPGYTIPASIEFSNDLTAVLNQAAIVVNAVPTQFIRSYFTLIENFDFSHKIIVNVSKGIEVSSGLDIRNIFLQAFKTITDDNFVNLAGPSFATEVSINPSPTVVVAASKNLATANTVRDLFSSTYFRVYSSDDVTGVEVGGSIKNIIAIAAGIVDGLHLGHNTKAALLTRGLAEMTRFGVKMGAKRETFSGLSGIGDMILTCNSSQSRNWQVGNRLGKGEKLKDILASMFMVAEGVETARSVFQVSQKIEVEMPITTMVYKVLFEDKCPKEAVYELMNRAYKVED